MKRFYVAFTVAKAAVRPARTSDLRALLNASVGLALFTSAGNENGAAHIVCRPIDPMSIYTSFVK